FYLLLNLEKSHNKKQKVEDIEDCIMKLRHHGIKVHGMFVLGSDEDDAYTIERTIRFCHKWKIDTVQFAILVPLPGTELYSTLSSQKRILTRKWPLYDGLHVVFGPKKMLPYELQMKTLWAWKKFYSLSRNLKEYFVSRHLIKEWGKGNKAFLKRLRRSQ
ncbi:radical SAM protein, partial [candidate division NPL-UPA2 bacterium]|nr:radical SAM protein [candidate division NPL-UPA2 bacterium]